MLIQPKGHSSVRLLLFCSLVWLRLTDDGAVLVSLTRAHAPLTASVIGT